MSPSIESPGLQAVLERIDATRDTAGVPTDEDALTEYIGLFSEQIAAMKLSPPPSRDQVVEWAADSLARPSMTPAARGQLSTVVWAEYLAICDAGTAHEIAEEQAVDARRLAALDPERRRRTLRNRAKRDRRRKG